MFDYLQGKLIKKNPTSVTLDVQGVGYHVWIPLSTFTVLPEHGEACKLWTHFVVREDAQLLYGFATEDERSLFQLLISISGIGPKLGITILSGRSHEDLKRAIAEGSLAFLTGITGIGRKTAERIIIELREKIVIDSKVADSEVSGMSTNISSSTIEDSMTALMELGYKKQTARSAIEKVLKELDDEKLTVSDLIRASLQHV